MDRIVRNTQQSVLSPGKQWWSNLMEYLIGVILALVVAGIGAIVGFDRERAFYPTVLIVIGSYYALFAAMGASGRAVLMESIVGTVFLLFAAIGFRKNLWFVVIGLVGHGVFDFLHHLFIANPGVPHWWPGFCLVFDVIVGGILAIHLTRHPEFSLSPNTSDRAS